MAVSGQSIRRKEDIRFITGKGRYTDDVCLPDQCHAIFARSPIAHANITSIDTTVAAAMPGVQLVLTGADYAESGLGTLVCGWMIHSKDGSEMKPGIHPPLALGKVRHVGDPVAVVIADSRQMARDAAEMIDVEYEDLAAVVSLKNAAGHESSVHNEVPGNVAFD